MNGRTHPQPLARLGLAVLGGARLGTAWQGIIFTARRSAMHCMAWLGTVGLGSARHGMAPFGKEGV